MTRHIRFIVAYKGKMTDYWADPIVEFSDEEFARLVAAGKDAMVERVRPRFSDPSVAYIGVMHVYPLGERVYTGDEDDETLSIVPVEKIPSPEQLQPVPEPAALEEICFSLRSLCERSVGIGIAAVQAGLPYRLFLVKGDGTNTSIPKNEYAYFVDCEYSSQSHRINSVEGCLSVKTPDGRLREFDVPRYHRIIVRGKRFYPENLLYEDVYAVIDADQQGIVFQHEIDHHRGILISDVGVEVS